jgi:hypothetical protein
MGISRAVATQMLTDAINNDTQSVVRDTVLQLLAPEIEDHFGDLPITSVPYMSLKQQVEESERTVMKAVDLARTALINHGYQVRRHTIEELVGYLKSEKIQLLKSLLQAMAEAIGAKSTVDLRKKSFCKTKEAALAYVNHFIKVTAAELTIVKRPVNDNYLNVARENGRTSEANALAFLLHKNLCVVNRFGGVLHSYDNDRRNGTIYLIKDEWYDHYDKGELYYS